MGTSGFYERAWSLYDTPRKARRSRDSNPNCFVLSISKWRLKVTLKRIEITQDILCLNSFHVKCI